MCRVGKMCYDAKWIFLTQLQEKLSLSPQMYVHIVRLFVSALWPNKFGLKKTKTFLPKFCFFGHNF